MSKLSDKIYTEVVLPLYPANYSSELFFDTEKYYVLFDNHYWSQRRALVVRKEDSKQFWYTINGGLTSKPATFYTNYPPDLFITKKGIFLYNNISKYPFLLNYFYRGKTTYRLDRNNLSVIEEDPILKVNKKILNIVANYLTDKESLICTYDRLSKYADRFKGEVNGLDENLIKFMCEYPITYYCEVWYGIDSKTLKDKILNLPYATHEYRDYIRLRTIVYPERAPKRYPIKPKLNLIKKLHDELVLLNARYEEFRNKKMLEELNNKYLKNSYEQSKRLEFSNNEYSIICPKHVVELNTEGALLHHCVASYKESVAEGKEYILFLRRNSNLEEPFMTINIDKFGFCRQIHGVYNNNIKDQSDSNKISLFLSDWADKNNFLNKESIITNCNQIHCHL